MASARGFFGGGEAEYLQLRVDGMALADPESGLADWRGVRALAVERVEALRGPASPVYGDTALAGVVEVVTRRRATNGELGAAAFAAGSFESRSADLVTWLGGESAALRLLASGAEADGWREHAVNDERGVEIAADLPAGERIWRLDLGGTRRDREEPGPIGEELLAADPRSSDPRFRFDRDRSRRSRASLRLESGGELAWRAALSGNRREGEAVRTLLLAPEFADRQRRDTATEVLALGLDSDLGLDDDGQLHFGLDAARERMRTGYRPVDEEGATGDENAAARVRRERLALFAAGSFALGARLRLTAGGRWDRIEDRPETGASVREEAWSPRAGATLDLGRGVAAFVQASRAFKAPTPDQRFDPRPFPSPDGGSFTLSSPDLVAQRARTLESGLRFAGTELRAELVAYRTDMEKEIDFDPATFRYANLGATTHDGIELDGAWTGERARASLGWAWTRVEPRAGPNRGRQLKNVPLHRVRTGAGLDWGGGWSADAAATWLDGRFLDDAERFPLDDAWIVDLRLQRRFARWRARLDLLNAADARWVSVGYVLTDLSGVDRALQFPAPGRALRLGAEISF